MCQASGSGSYFSLLIHVRCTELPQDEVVQGNTKAEAGRKEGRDQGGSGEAATDRALLSSLCC